MCELIRFFHGRGAILNLEGEGIDIAGMCILAPENLCIDFLNRQRELLHIVMTVEKMEAGAHWLTL